MLARNTQKLNQAINNLQTSTEQQSSALASSFCESANATEEVFSAISGGKSQLESTTELTQTTASHSEK